LTAQGQAIIALLRGSNRPVSASEMARRSRAGIPWRRSARAIIEAHKSFDNNDL
jgi:hypothetical protein